MRGFCDVLADHYLWPNLLQQFKSFVSVCAALWSKWLFMNFFSIVQIMDPWHPHLMLELYSVCCTLWWGITTFSLRASVYLPLYGILWMGMLSFISYAWPNHLQLSPVQFSGCCCFEQRQINLTNCFASTRATLQRNILFLCYVILILVFRFCGISTN